MGVLVADEVAVALQVAVGTSVGNDCVFNREQALNDKKEQINRRIIFFIVFSFLR